MSFSEKASDFKSSSMFGKTSFRGFFFQVQPLFLVYIYSVKIEKIRTLRNSLLDQ